MATAGKRLMIRVSTTGLAASWAEVLEMNDASVSIDGANEDITSFGAEWISRLQTLKDASYSLSGFYKNTDTTGQIRIRDALINDTSLFVQFINDRSDLATGFQQEVKVSSFEVSGAVDGVQELSIELEGHGAATTVLT